MSKFLNQVITTTLFLTVFFLPLIATPKVSNPYEYPKFLALIVAAGLVLISTIFYQLLIRKILLTFDLTNLLIIGYLVIVGISNIQGFDPQVSFWGSAFRHQGFLTLISAVSLAFATRIFINTPKRKKMLFKVILTSGIFVSLFVFWQIVRVKLLHDPYVALYQGRFIGAFGNPNFLGGYLSMTLPFLLLSPMKKILTTPFILIIFTAIISTFSRGAWLPATFVATAAIVHYLLKKKRLFKSAIIVIVIFTATASYLSRNTLGDVFLRHSVWEDRTLIWQAGLEAALARPILGYGQENFELIFDKLNDIKVDSAHNIFIEVLVASGIPALILFLAIWINAVRKANLTVSLALMAFLIRGLFNPLSISEIALFWILIGISAYQPHSTLSHSKNNRLQGRSL